MLSFKTPTTDNTRAYTIPEGDLQYLSEEGLGIIENRVSISKKMKRVVHVQMVRDLGDPRWNVLEGPCINTSRSIYPQDPDDSLPEFPGRFI